MAYFDQDFANPKRRFRDAIARLFETPFDRRSRFLAARVRLLRAMTDGELAKLGIQRDQILFHVFAGKQG